MNKYDLNERELQEIELCQHYVEFYGHGTPGHQRMVVIDKLVKILNQRENEIKDEILKGIDAVLQDLDDHYKKHYEEQMLHSDVKSSIAADLAFEEAMRVVRETREAIKDE